MSVIIRLQGLSWSASASDIRNFFTGLSIPPGGVRIIGGEKGDAFIAFSTDEDARRAMMMSNKLLNDGPVQLFLSSKTEMQNTIQEAKNVSTPAVSTPGLEQPSSAINLPQQQFSTPPQQQSFPVASQPAPNIAALNQPALASLSQLQGLLPSNITQALGFLANANINSSTLSNLGAQSPAGAPNQQASSLSGEYSGGGINNKPVTNQSPVNTSAHTNFNNSNVTGQSQSYGQNFPSQGQYPPRQGAGQQNNPRWGNPNQQPFGNNPPSTGPNRFPGPNQNIPYGNQNRPVPGNQPFNQQETNVPFGGEKPISINYGHGNHPTSTAIVDSRPPAFGQQTNKGQPGGFGPHTGNKPFSGGVPPSTQQYGYQGVPPKPQDTRSAFGENKPDHQGLSDPRIPQRPGTRQDPRSSPFTQDGSSGRPDRPYGQNIGQKPPDNMSGPGLRNNSALNPSQPISQQPKPTNTTSSTKSGQSTEVDEFGRIKKSDSKSDFSKSDKSKGRDDERRNSRDRDRSRRDSPRDRDRRDRDRDRDSRRRDRDDDRRTRRDRDRSDRGDKDRDRGRRDRESDRRDRSRDLERKSPASDLDRRSKKRSLSPSSKKEENDKKFQSERPGNSQYPGQTSTPHPVIASSAKTVTAATGPQPLFPVIQPTNTSKGLLGSPPQTLKPLQEGGIHVPPVPFQIQGGPPPRPNLPGTRPQVPPQGHIGFNPRTSQQDVTRFQGQPLMQNREQRQSRFGPPNEGNMQGDHQGQPPFTRGYIPDDNHRPPFDETEFPHGDPRPYEHKEPNNMPQRGDRNFDDRPRPALLSTPGIAEEGFQPRDFRGPPDGPDNPPFDRRPNFRGPSNRIEPFGRPQDRVADDDFRVPGNRFEAGRGNPPPFMDRNPKFGGPPGRGMPIDDMGPMRPPIHCGPPLDDREPNFFNEPPRPVDGPLLSDRRAPDYHPGNQDFGNRRGPADIQKRPLLELPHLGSDREFPNANRAMPYDDQQGDGPFEERYEDPFQDRPFDGPNRDRPPFDGPGNIPFDEPHRERPPFDGPNRDRPPIGGPYRDRPPFDGPNRDRPPFDGPNRDRPPFYGPNQDGPPFDGLNRDRPHFDGLNRDGPPFDGPNRDRPPFDGPNRDRPPFDGPNRDRPPFDGPNRDRPPFDGPNRDRPPFDGPNRDRPPFDGPNRDRPPFDGPNRDRPPFDGPNRDRPPFDAPNRDRPPFDGPNRDRPPFDGPNRDRPPFDGPNRDRPPFDGPNQDRPPFDGPNRDRPPFDGPDRDRSSDKSTRERSYDRSSRDSRDRPSERSNRDRRTDGGSRDDNDRRKRDRRGDDYNRSGSSGDDRRDRLEQRDRNQPSNSSKSEVSGKETGDDRRGSRDQRTSDDNNKSRPDPSLRPPSTRDSERRGDSSGESSRKSRDSSDTDKKSSTTEPSASALCSVLVENLALETSYKEIRRFFNDSEIVKDGIKLVNDRSGNRVGKAYVRFASQEAYKRAMMKNKLRLLGKQITIKSVPGMEYDLAEDDYQPEYVDNAERSRQIDMCNTLSAAIRNLKGQGDLRPPPSKPIQQQKTSDWVMKITMLPYDTTAGDIRSFFKGCEIANKGEAVFLESDRKHGCTGLCYVEFANADSYKKAMGLKRVFKGSTIAVSSGNKDNVEALINKMNRELKSSSNETPKTTENVITANTQTNVYKPPNVESRPKEDAKKPPGGNSDNSARKEISAAKQPETPSLPTNKSVIHMKNIPLDFNGFSVRALFIGMPVTILNVQLPHDAIGKKVGEAFADFGDAQSVQTALAAQDSVACREKNIVMTPITKIDMINLLRDYKQCVQLEAPTKHDVFYFVKASNLPKNVKTGELMTFFSGYNPAPESIRLNVPDLNAVPDTSAALIGFRMREDAERAVQTINSRPLRNRPISLEKVII